MNKIVIKKILWDEGNIAHIARHDVLPSEVEEALEVDRVEWEAYKKRIFIVGPTKAGRMLTVILEPKIGTGIYKPITAYDASKTSIRAYTRETGVKKQHDTTETNKTKRTNT